MCESSFNAFAKLLSFLVEREQENLKNNNSNNEEEEEESTSATASTSKSFLSNDVVANSFLPPCCWYECAATQYVDPCYIITTEENPKTIACIFGTQENQEQEEQTVVQTQQPKLILGEENFRSFSSSSSKKFKVIAVEEMKKENKERTITLIIDENFTKEAAVYCDKKLFEFLLLRKKQNKSSLEELFQENNNNNFDKELLNKIISVRLFLAPNNYQCWNLRKEMFQYQNLSSSSSSTSSNFSEFLKIWRKEMTFNAIIYSRLPKSPDSWYHRIFLMQKLFEKIKLLFGEEKNKQLVDVVDKFLLQLVQQESQHFASRACDVYKRCYPSWEYRRVIWKLLFENFKNKNISLTCLIHNEKEEKEKQTVGIPLFQAAIDEIVHHFAWFETNPGDASCVCAFATFFEMLIEHFSFFESNNDNNERTTFHHLLEKLLLQSWELSQTMIKRNLFISRSNNSKTSSNNEKQQFVVPQLSHESIWLFRKVVVEMTEKLFSSEKNKKSEEKEEVKVKHKSERRRILVVQNNYTSENENENENENEKEKEKEEVVDVLLIGNWTLQNEIEFVSVFIESHELAMKISEEKEKSNESEEKEEVLNIPLNIKDWSLASQGQFASMHATKYLLWLLSRFR